MTVKHWGGEVGIVWFNVHIPCSSAWDTMISYMALISTPGTTHGKVLVNLVPNGIKKKVSSQVEVILVDNKRWNKITENQIKFIDVAKEWMHGCVIENVRKIEIKLENIRIDLIRSIYAPYRPLWTLTYICAGWTYFSLFSMFFSLIFYPKDITISPHHQHMHDRHYPSPQHHVWPQSPIFSCSLHILLLFVRTFPLTLHV